MLGFIFIEKAPGEIWESFFVQFHRTKTKRTIDFDKNRNMGLFL